MLAAKTINYKDNVIFVVHALPKNMCSTHSSLANLSRLNGLGKIFSITNNIYNTPQELHPAGEIFSTYGKIPPKEIPAGLKEKNIYLAGGNLSCCLANAAKSFYPLARYFEKDLSFFLIEDYIWQVYYEEPLPLNKYYQNNLIAFPRDYTVRAFLYPNKRIEPLEYFLGAEPAKKNKVNIVMYYKKREDLPYTSSIFYADEKNRHTISLVVCSMRDIRRYGGAQNIPLE